MRIRSVWGLTVLLTTAPALAQKTTADIRVGLSALRGPASGVTVLAVNTLNGFATKGIARADGSFFLTGLPPGEYVITVTQPDGKETYRTVTVQVGQTVDLNINVEEETALDLGQGETLFVQGKTPEARAPRSPPTSAANRSPTCPRATATSSTSRPSRPAFASPTMSSTRTSRLARSRRAAPTCSWMA
ncbi:carboxypeptidase-like regulatory domain-containing protein [Cystobacter fuscus]